MEEVCFHASSSITRQGALENERHLDILGHTKEGGLRSRESQGPLTCDGSVNSHSRYRAGSAAHAGTYRGPDGCIHHAHGNGRQNTDGGGDGIAGGYQGEGVIHSQFKAEDGTSGSQSQSTGDTGPGFAPAE